MKAFLKRGGQGFVVGSLVGVLAGLIGLGGGEFRLPVLVGLFKIPTLRSIVLNRAISLIVASSALIFRCHAISLERLAQHTDVIFNLLAGTLLGAWFAAGHAMKMPRRLLNQIVMFLLVGLAIMMLAEACLGLHGSLGILFENTALRLVAGTIAGFAIGTVVALLGVAGGELFIPTMILLYQLDIKLAGSLTLVVSLPTMLVDFARYSRCEAFAVISEERPLFFFMAAGSIVGAAIGAMLLGIVPANMLTCVLATVLLLAAIKTFQHQKADSGEQREEPALKPSEGLSP